MSMVRIKAMLASPSLMACLQAERMWDTRGQQAVRNGPSETVRPQWSAHKNPSETIRPR
jgi:hypothetical protein